MSSSKPLVLPALRANMGDWIYYITYMKMEAIANRISRAQTLYDSKILEELLQRDLQGQRAIKIKEYLVSQPQRFFNSLVIGTCAGDPQWTEIKLEGPLDTGVSASEDFEGILGFLTFTGKEKLFAIDGQHRVEGIRITIKDHPELGHEEIPIIIVKGIEVSERLKDPSGFQRTRRLFSTLNRYAKPVSKKAIITLDEDDAIAIITRRLIEEYALFSDGKLSLSNSSSMSSMSSSDKQALTNINTLYEALNTYLIEKPKSGWDQFKRFYPGEEKVNELYASSIALWDAFCKYFNELEEVCDSNPEDEIAVKYRHVDGGNIIFRPIGLLIYVKIVRLLIEHEKLSLEKAVERVSKIPRDLSNDPWNNIVWNIAGKRMLTGAVNRKAAEKVMYHAVGGNLSVLKSGVGQLHKDIAAIRQIEVKDVRLYQIPEMKAKKTS